MKGFIKNMKIDFLCVGFSKCGTTSLYDTLKQHPDIFLPKIKEIPFFVRPEFYKLGISWYKKRFFEKNLSKVSGEINPLYTTKNIARILSKYFSPNTKIIFIMRNPVDRMYSHFRMDMKYGYELIPKFLQHSDINSQFNYYVKHNCRLNEKKIVYDELMMSGNYYRTICEYMKYFKKENMLFLYFEDYISNPEVTFKEITDFLGIKSKKISNNKISNEGNIIPRNKFCIKIRHYLCILRRKWLKYGSQQWDNIMNTILDFFLYHATVKQEKEKHYMDLETRKYLEEYYRQDKNNLEKLLNIDLSKKWF